MKTHSTHVRAGLRTGFVVLAFATVAALALPASADDSALRQHYRLAISAEVCGFEISDAQAEGLSAAMDAEIAKLNLSDAAADELYTQVEGDLEAQGWDNLCAADGEWAKTFARDIAKFGG